MSETYERHIAVTFVVRSTIDDIPDGMGLVSALVDALPREWKGPHHGADWWVERFVMAFDGETKPITKTRTIRFVGEVDVQTLMDTEVSLADVETLLDIDMGNQRETLGHGDAVWQPLSIKLGWPT